MIIIIDIVNSLLTAAIVILIPRTKGKPPSFASELLKSELQREELEDKLVIKLVDMFHCVTVSPPLLLVNNYIIVVTYDVSSLCKHNH